MSENVSVLGAGAWGTALAHALSEQGHHVSLWARDEGLAEALRTDQENRRYLPGIRLAPQIKVTASLAASLAGATAVLVALPSTVVRDVAVRAAGFRGLAICAAKGIERASFLTLDRVLAEVWPDAQVALLSGPTFALEIARGLPGAAVVASADPAAAERAQALLSSERLRTYTSDDVVGVAIGGALKNVVAIAAGCADGLGFGHNARAAIITRGLHEMGRLALRLGGNPLTLAGLAGLGDLVLTCTGELSRNRQVGLALGAGTPLSVITAGLGHVAEGIETAATAAAWAAKLGVDMPITERVAAVVSGRLEPRVALAELLAREVRAERV